MTNPILLAGVLLAVFLKLRLVCYRSNSCEKLSLRAG